ncbi:hypothetical protein NLX86_13520 [Streptomyces sp. A3M-1-3]|uniref:hypothetical protein n=1 Tax=Streptomyces sp. A3M-1-3 TaxID=2962044 RepID=UPI0020B6C130|nr:hypothetical protein [Streptomyces sp. A3M-1-3]MCP3819095.1 hypothetical protein [Streptomyces sp. A3M-1-3]
MVGNTIDFTEERAPCGRIVDGLRYQEEDAAGLFIDEVTYACGCRQVRREFHDGSVRVKTVRHDGTVLQDEHSAEHEV